LLEEEWQTTNVYKTKINPEKCKIQNYFKVHAPTSMIGLRTFLQSS